MTKRQLKAVPRKVTLEVFYARYAAVLEAVARRVHALVARGQKYSTTMDLSVWISKDLPTLYRQTFGVDVKALRAWRVKTMLSNANYLGAFEALDIRSVRGQGITSVVKPRGRLRVIAGGKRA
jgi:hypothetical protein